MWIFDLGISMFCVLVVIITTVVAAKQYDKRKNPPPSLQEKINYYEALNESLRKEQEV